MDPEEFRRFGHQVVDWIADYRARAAGAAGHVPRGARIHPGPAPGLAAGRARGVRSDPRRPRPGGRARPLALAAPALLRLLPLERRAVVGPGRLPQHGAGRPRPLLAVEPGADRDRGDDDRLGAADDRPLRRLERGHPGHGLLVHAGRAHLREGEGLGLLARARRAAGREPAARRLRLGPQPQLGGQGGPPRGLRPGERPRGGDRRGVRDAARRARRGDPGRSRRRPDAVRGRGHDRHHDHDRPRPHGRDRVGRAPPTASGSTWTRPSPARP